MKITWKPALEKHEPTLARLLIGDTFMFTEYDETIGPFLVIDQENHYLSKKYMPNIGVFVLNLAKNTIHHRTITAKVQPVNCEITVR